MDLTHPNRNTDHCDWNSPQLDDRRDRIWTHWQLWFLVLLVCGIFFSRLTILPVVNEECRWARGAVNMIDSGDWVVLRQQGQVFPERPPMSSWLMAVGGVVRGQVDAIAVRLPSATAVLLTVVLIYWYALKFAGRLAAFSCAAVYTTTGQVMDLGRLGESDAVFAFFTGGSLLVWHGLSTASRKSNASSSWIPWIAGYSFAAMGALTKGPQAPVYFICIVGIYLVVSRRAREIVSAGHWMGLATFVAIISAWQIPYYLATNWDSTVATWTGLVRDRLTIAGMIEHLIDFPIEMMTCLLPWSPMLLCFFSRSIRRSMATYPEMVRFSAIAVLVAFPTVWLVTGARPRYFMPLYPCTAILFGLLLERIAMSADGYPARVWRRFVVFAAVAGLIAGSYLVLANVTQRFPAAGLHWQPWSLSITLAGLICAISILLGILISRGYPSFLQRSAYLGIGTSCAVFGFIYTGLIVSGQAQSWNDISSPVVHVRSIIDDPGSLVSLGPIDHRFAYAYQMPIAEISWPESISDLPQNVDYFCFTKTGRDTPEVRYSGRGRSWRLTPGTLPFEWQPIAEIPCDRKLRGTAQITVIIARAVPGRMASSPGPNAERKKLNKR